MALATSCALATISPGSLVLRLPAKARATHVCRASSKTETRLARDDLLGLIANEERGVKTQKNSNQREQIIKAIEALGVLGSEQTTTNDSLSATWRMLWTTEKEQLFIIEKMAPFFGTQAGDILQVSQRSQPRTSIPDMLFSFRCGAVLANSLNPEYEKCPWQFNFSDSSWTW